MAFKHAACVAVLIVAAQGEAQAQIPAGGRPAMPSAATIAGADAFQPPRLADLAARLASQPDMTGVWIHLEPPGSCAGPLFNPANASCPPPAVAGEATFGPLPGTKLLGIPYTAEYQKIYDRNVEDAKRGFARDTFAACVPYGVPRMIGESPVPIDIIQAPDVMTWYANYGQTQRRIFLDGRQHPAPNDSPFSGPSYSGHSIGHWEGNTLVVETVDMINAFFDETAAPHSDKLTLVERIRLIDADMLENQMTLTDPVAFTRPWVVTRYYARRAPTAADIPKTSRGYLNLNDRPCVPNVRIDDDGFQVLMLPAEIEEAQARAKGMAVK